MTLIVIIIDGKLHCSFDGELEPWRHQRFFKVVTPKPSVRIKQLKIFGNVHLELDMILALFCYDMVNPTRRRIEDDMHHYQVEQYRKSKG